MERHMAAVLPTLLKNFKAVAAPARTADPKTIRRQTFMKAVSEQMQMIDNPQLTRAVKVKGGETKAVPVKPWFFDSADGLILQPKFGVRSVELAPGANALRLSNRGELKKALEGLAAAAAAGELDDALARAQPAPKPKKPAPPAKAS